MHDIFKMGLKLFLITAVAAALLGLTNMATEEPIKQQIEKENTQARKSVLPEAVSFEKKEIVPEYEAKEDAKLLEVFEGKKGDKVVGYVFKAASKGFGGWIEVMVGINTDGIIEAVSVVKHQETPGLGAKAAEEKFRLQYFGKSVNTPLAVVKKAPSKDNEIEAITGATITSRAVTRAVNLSMEYYRNVFEGEMGAKTK